MHGVTEFFTNFWLPIDKHVLINYLHKWMEWMLPEEFRPEVQHKDQKAPSKREEKDYDFSAPLMFSGLSKDMSIRQRTLSVIKEEIESGEE